MDILKNKSYKEYDRLSRYSIFPYYYNTLDKKYMYGTVSSLQASNDYDEYIPTGGESYDLIALNCYGNPTYYWIICDFNNIIDPFINPIEGSRLKIPKLSNIEFNLD